MTPEIRRQALRAAQKLALTLTMAGCANAHTDPLIMADAGERDAAALDATALDAFVADGGADADLWADLGLEGRDGSVDGGPTVNACIADLSAYLASADPAVVVPARPGDTQCCTDVQAFIDGDGTTWGYWEDENLRSYCCGTVLNWESFGSCTPWGPPMPPAMPTEVLA
jgi:hypothetical protein